MFIQYLTSSLSQCVRSAHDHFFLLHDHPAILPCWSEGKSRQVVGSSVLDFLLPAFVDAFFCHVLNKGYSAGTVISTSNSSGCSPSIPRLNMEPVIPPRGVLKLTVPPGL